MAIVPEPGPDPKLNDAYDTMYAEEPDSGQKNGIDRRNGISCATRFIFFTKTTAWPRPRNGFATSAENYPDMPLL